MTEFWWISEPPSSPIGVRERKHARWLAEALYLFWKQGARAAFWFQVVDPSPCDACVNTGLHLRSGDPRAAFRAFRFPFVVDPRVRSGNRALAWGRAPAAGPVRIERKREGEWRRLRTLQTGPPGVFTATVRVPGSGKLRAGLPSGEVSLPWRTG